MNRKERAEHIRKHSTYGWLPKEPPSYITLNGYIYTRTQKVKDTHADVLKESKPVKIVS